MRLLAVHMAAPHTYTREDVVEIHCHGSFLVLQNVLELILASGAVLASPANSPSGHFSTVVLT